MADSHPGPVSEALVDREPAARPRARALTAEERATILEAWNRTDVEFPTGRLVHEQIADEAARRPDAIAVADAAGRMTYGDLDRRANRLANRLRALGVGPEERVCVSMESSRELVVAYLGVLRAGGAYVPVDPESPADRVDFLLEDSGARAVLTRDSLTDRFASAGRPVVKVSLDDDFLVGESDEAPRSGVGPRNLVYVIYTSGSTGTPKGVLIEHRNLLNLVGVYGGRLAITEDDRTAMLAGVAFDAAVVDIWPYLVRGASLHAPDPQTRVDPRRLVPWLIDHQIDVVSLPTALGEAVFREDWSRSSRLRACLVGGDKLHAAPRQRLPFVLYNSYGPTECTVDSTWFAVPTGVDEPQAPPIGRPLDNYRAYVVDPDFEPLPVGEKGELWIGGAGVARGYLNRPELSAEKFLADPFRDGPDDRVYRTGDLVCFRHDGEIEFHGRIDDQVQIRGYRVEPGEVEVVLSGHADVEAAAVLAREDTPGRVRLVAYVVSSKPSAALLPALRSFAGDRLPPYMVPTLVAIDELPMTLNGKVDRRALRPPEEYAGWRGEAGGAAARDDVERRLVEIWCDVLQLDDVGIDEGFFDLGGDSLSVVTLLVAVEKVLGVEVEVPDLLRAPTIERLARIVRGDDVASGRSVVVPLRADGAGAPFFCVAGAGGGCHWFGELSRLLRPDRPFLGLEPIRPPDAEHTIEAIAAGLVEEIRRIQPEGPYHLGGYSTGGMVAFEIAQQLRRSGAGIGLLALIEADGARDYSTRAGQVVAFARNLSRMNPARAVRIVLDRAAFALGAMRQRLRQSAETKVVAAKLDARKEEDEAALHAYVPQSYDGDVHVFACEERPMTATVDPSYGWAGPVRGRIVARIVPGDHYSMLGLPAVRTLARDLQAALDEAAAVTARSVDPDGSGPARQPNL